MSEIAHERSDMATTQALDGFRGMVGLTVCGQPGEQMVHASEVCGVVDFNTPSVNTAQLLASDSIDLSSIRGPEVAETAPEAAAPRQMPNKLGLS